MEIFGATTDDVSGSPMYVMVSVIVFILVKTRESVVSLPQYRNDAASYVYQKAKNKLHIKYYSE